jgi:hypothetical protein
VITSAGEPPTDVVDALVVPSTATVVASSHLDAAVGQYDRGITMTVPASAKSLVSFYTAELKSGGWSVEATQPVSEADGRTGTEILAQRESSDGYYWEVGVTVRATNPSITPALSGAGSPPVSTSVDLRLLEVPDGN